MTGMAIIEIKSEGKEHEVSISALGSRNAPGPGRMLKKAKAGDLHPSECDT